jgi:hypothetical protein
MGVSAGFLFTMRAIMSLVKRLRDFVTSPDRPWRRLLQRRLGKKKRPTSGATAAVPNDANSQVGPPPEVPPNSGEDEVRRSQSAEQVDKGPLDIESPNQLGISPPVNGDARSEVSVDATVGEVDSNIGDNDQQLNSIPPHTVDSEGKPPAPASEEVVPATVPASSPESSELTIETLITRLPINQVLQFLSMSDMVRLGHCNTVLRHICGEHLLHNMLPGTYIKFYTRLRKAGTKTRSTEWLSLYPVIKRVAKLDRVLPANRVVYEPDFKQHRRLDRPGEFVPDLIEFHLPDHPWPYRWYLGAERTTSPRQYVPTSRNRHRDYEVRNDPEAITVQTDYYKFEDLKFGGSRRADDFPVNIFYKRDPQCEAAKLLAISIPWDHLLKRLLHEPCPARGDGSRPGIRRVS